MPSFKFDWSPISAVADELIPLYHGHLLENRVRMAYRFSSQESKSHGRNKYGEVRKIINAVASLISDEEAIDRQFDKFTFVCVKCLAWKAEVERAMTEINGEDHDFCESCHDALDNSKVQDPDDHFLAWLKEREVKAEAIRNGGPATSEAIWLLVLYKGQWDLAGPEVHRAMVDQLLCACGSSINQEGQVRLTKIPPEVVTYNSVLVRHGTEWNGLLEQAAQTIRNRGQLTLTLSDDERKAA